MEIKRTSKPGGKPAAKPAAEKGRKKGSNEVRNAAIRARVRALLIASVPPTEIYPLLAEEFGRPAREIRLRHDEVKRAARDIERKSADAYWQWLLEANVENLARLQAEKDWRGVQGQLKQIAELTGAEAPKRIDVSTATALRPLVAMLDDATAASIGAAFEGLEPTE